MEITQFTSGIRFIEGKANIVADWLSRPPGVPLGKAYDIKNEDTIGSIKLEIISHKELAEAQKQCPDVKAHREGKLPNRTMAEVEFSPETVLYCKMDGNVPKPLVPQEFRQTIIKLYH